MFFEKKHETQNLQNKMTKTKSQETTIVFWQGRRGEGGKRREMVEMQGQEFSSCCCSLHCVVLCNVCHFSWYLCIVLAVVSCMFVFTFICVCICFASFVCLLIFFVHDQYYVCFLLAVCFCSVLSCFCLGICFCIVFFTFLFCIFVSWHSFFFFLQVVFAFCCFLHVFVYFFAFSFAFFLMQLFLFVFFHFFDSFFFSFSFPLFSFFKSCSFAFLKF